MSDDGKPVIFAVILGWQKISCGELARHFELARNFYKGQLVILSSSEQAQAENLMDYDSLNNTYRNLEEQFERVWGFL